MKSKDDSMDWIPLWVDKWIFGSTRIELKHDERAIFTDLLALASKDNGFIRANTQTAYPITQLAGLLCAPEDLVQRTIDRCFETGKLTKSPNGIGFYVTNWTEYQFSRRHKNRFYHAVFNASVPESGHDVPNLGHEESTCRIGEDRIGKDIKESFPHLIVDKSKSEPLKVKCDICGKPYAIKEDHKCE